MDSAAAQATAQRAYKRSARRSCGLEPSPLRGLPLRGVCVSRLVSVLWLVSDGMAFVCDVSGVSSVAFPFLAFLGRATSISNYRVIVRDWILYLQLHE